MKKLLIRSLVAIVLGPLILILTWMGGFYFLGMIIGIVLFTLYEFYAMCKRKEASSIHWLGMSASSIICYFGYLNQWSNLWLIIVPFLIVCMLVELFRNKPNPILNVALSLMGPLYVGIPFAFLLSIRMLPELSAGNAGAKMVMLIFACVWLCDTAAYLFGARFGRRKLMPRVSPNKTIEGTAAGFLFAIVGAYIFQIFFLNEISLLDAVALGGICGSFGQASDLVESLFKRDAGIKDSSHLIPGHGGMLDRFDSQLVVVPIAYLYITQIML